MNKALPREYSLLDNIDRVVYAFKCEPMRGHSCQDHVFCHEALLLEEGDKKQLFHLHYDSGRDLYLYEYFDEKVSSVLERRFIGKTRIGIEATNKFIQRSIENDTKLCPEDECYLWHSMEREKIVEMMQIDDELGVNLVSTVCVASHSWTSGLDHFLGH